MKRQKSRVADRRADAIARQEYRDKLSATEQLARLDKILGKGVGATKERRKLNASRDSTKPKRGKGKHSK
jgi:hypothetical protein